MNSNTFDFTQKLAAINIVYNPQSMGIINILNNILSYKKYCKVVYIVDNSSDTNEDLFKSIPDIIYVSNKNKGGIAGAQNLGCKKALEDGFEWVMTMDQDSFFEDDQIESYMNLVSEYISSKNDAVSFAPRIVDLNESRYWTHLLRKNMLGPLKRKIFGKKEEESEEIVYPTEVIASSNIINLNAWKEVGGFDEFLFIEQVDFDFCHQLIQKGFKIVKFNSVTLNQHFGKRVFALLKKNYPWYNDARMYYVFRNLLIEIYRFPQYSKKYRRILKLRFFDYCINTINPIGHFINYKRAFKDYKIYIANPKT